MQIALEILNPRTKNSKTELEFSADLLIVRRTFNMTNIRDGDKHQAEEEGLIIYIVVSITQINLNERLG